MTGNASVDVVVVFESSALAKGIHIPVTQMRIKKKIVRSHIW
jgi:hypothetical protein